MNYENKIFSSMLDIYWVTSKVVNSAINYVKGVKSVIAKANTIFWEKRSFHIIYMKSYKSWAYVI